MKIINLMALTATAAGVSASGSNKHEIPSFIDQVKYAVEARKNAMALGNSSSSDVYCEWGVEEYCYDENGEEYCANIADGGCECAEGEVKCGGDDYWTGYCTTLCCDYGTETCLDDQGNPSFCAAIEDGGCPCPEGMEKCNGYFGWSGYCATLCCDDWTEELCFDSVSGEEYCALNADGGCPCAADEVKCGMYDGYAGYCTPVCCDDAIEETCYNEDTWEPTGCELIADGGCPCPDDEVKCGMYDGYAGYCTPVCCDDAIEETCYNEDTWEPTGCELIADGGCPCADDEVKCGMYDGYAGFCTPICCDSTTEETCYSEETWEPTECKSYEEGGCPCSDGEVKCGGDDYWPGYCTTLCCSDSQEYCWDDQSGEYCADYSDGGCPCPEGMEKCGAFGDYPGYCTDICCSDDQEYCWDDQSGDTFCADYSDGGCPCPDGEEKCGAFGDYPGYCTTLCCSDDQEYCWDDQKGEYCADYSDGGCPCPEGMEKCGAFEDYPGYCTDICCSDDQEYCWDDQNGEYCVDYSDGGCPCADGEEKCGAFGDYPGYCTTLCCSDDQEYCWDDQSGEYCADYSDGGCPCPEGTEKCGAEGDYPGWCSSICCNLETEQACYDDDYNVVCISLEDGGCPCENQDDVRCGVSPDYPGWCTPAESCCGLDEMTCYDSDWNPVSCVSLDGECPSPLKSKVVTTPIDEVAHENTKTAARFHWIMKQRNNKLIETDKTSIANRLNNDQSAFYRAMKNHSNTQSSPSKAKLAQEAVRRKLSTKNENAEFFRAMASTKKDFAVQKSIQTKKIAAISSKKKVELVFMHAQDEKKKALLAKEPTSMKSIERMLQDEKAAFYRATNEGV